MKTFVAILLMTFSFTQVCGQSQRNLTTYFLTQYTKIINDVTPDNNTKKARVYELRVYQPKAIRVYFFEYEGIVYLAKLEYKSSYKEEDSTSQTKDIKRALTTIDNMIKTR